MLFLSIGSIMTLKWEKLSPSEFDMLQDFIQCKYIQIHVHTITHVQGDSLHLNYFKFS